MGVSGRRRRRLIDDEALTAGQPKTSSRTCRLLSVVAGAWLAGCAMSSERASIEGTVEDRWMEREQ
jgi:hypothetical protein